MHTLKLTRPVSASAAQKVVRMCAAHTSAGALRFPLPKNAHLVLQQGNLTKWSGDAIVNAGRQPFFCLVWCDKVLALLRTQ